MSDTEIHQTLLIDSNGKNIGKMTILRGGLDSENPIAYMNNAVRKYVGTNLYNEFVEIQMDNPWIRVIISGICDLEYDEFKNQKLND